MKKSKAFLTVWIFWTFCEKKCNFHAVRWPARGALSKKGTPVLCEPAPSKCTWVLTRAILCENLQEKCGGQNSGAHCVRACAIEMLWTSHRSHLHEKCRAPRTRKTRGADFGQACAVEMHADISQERFYARIYMKNAGAQRAYPDLTPAVNTYSKNPSVWTHCLGKNT